MRKKLEREYFLFMIPAIILVVALRFFPIGNAFYNSLFDWNGYSATKEFIGLSNFKELLNDRYFWISLRNTLIYGFGITFVKNALGIALALFVNMKFKGRGAVRAIVYLPIMVSGFIMGQIMYFFFQYEGGVFNEILGYLHIAPVYWMETGLGAVFIVLMTTSVLHVGSTMLVYLAGLQHIPYELRESARLDGANHWQEFIHITIPLLQPAIISSVILNLIGSFKIYDIISALSKGGPDGGSQSLTMYISGQYYGYHRSGYACAIAFVFFLVIIVISWPLNLWLSSKKVEL